MSMTRFEIIDAIGFAISFIYCRFILWDSSFGTNGMMELVDCVAVSVYFMNKKIKKGKDVLLVLGKRLRKCALLSMIMLSCSGTVITILATLSTYSKC